MLNWILIFLFILLLPTQLGKHFFLDFSYLSGVRIDYLAPTLYVTDILSVIIIAVNFRLLTPLFKKLSFYIFLNATLLNIFFALNPYITLYKSVKIFEILFLFVIFKELFTLYKDKKIYKGITFSHLILTALNVGAALQLLLSVLQIIYKHAIQGPFYWLGERYVTLSMPDIAKSSIDGHEILRAYGTFSHPNSMAGFYLLLYFFVLTSQRFTKLPVLKNIFLFLSAALIFCTFAKIAIIIFFLLNMWYIYRYQKSIFANKFSIIQVLLAIVGLIFIFTKGDPFTLVKRSELFENAVVIYSQHPLFGTGLGGSLIAQNTFAMKYPYFFLQPVHNIFLLYLVEAGIVLTVATFYFLLKYFRSHPRSETYYYAVVVVFATGALDHYWLTLQQNMLLLPLIFALL